MEKFKDPVILEYYLQENYTLAEIKKGYKKFNPEFFNGHYFVPTSYQGWAEQIFEDLQDQILYPGEKVPGAKLSDIL